MSAIVRCHPTIRHRPTHATTRRENTAPKARVTKCKTKIWKKYKTNKQTHINIYNLQADIIYSKNNFRHFFSSQTRWREPESSNTSHLCCCSSRETCIYMTVVVFLWKEQHSHISVRHFWPCCTCVHNMLVYRKKVCQSMMISLSCCRVCEEKTLTGSSFLLLLGIFQNI